MTTKICTTIEQSKRLIELGLDVNTADMMWFDDGLGEPMEIVCSYNPTTSDDNPAWSLTALLELIQWDYKLEKTLFDQSDFIWRYYKKL